MGGVVLSQADYNKLRQMWDWYCRNRNQRQRYRRPRPQGGGAVEPSAVGLLAWYQFNNNAYDSSGHDRHGTFMGGMSAARDVAEFLDGDDYVDCGTDFIGNGPCSIAGWIRPFGWGEYVAAGQGRIIDNGSTYFFVAGSTLKYLGFTSNNSSGANSATSSIALHERQHVVVTRTLEGRANFYVNGLLSGTPDQDSGTPIKATNNLLIGTNAGSTKTFEGCIDDLRIYDRVLSAKEVRQLYEHGRRYGYYNEVFGACKIFEVQSAASGDGVYNCYEQTLDATEWTDTAGDPKFDDRNSTSIEVLNLAEFDPEATYVAQLAANDLLVAYRYWDDEGGARWVGVPFRKGAQGGSVRLAYVKTTPGATATVACYLDTDTTGTEITVTCHICGGSALNAAAPRLTDGDEIFVTKLGGTWYCTTVFDTDTDCDCYEA
ncbi:MAG: LamG domain-containing protein [Planctomycetota bacterium]|jgi:hypothetical protein